MRFILFGHRVEIAQAILQARRCRIGHAFTLSLWAVNIVGLPAKAATNRGSTGRQCRYAFANLFPDKVNKRRPWARDSILFRFWLYPFFVYAFP